MLDGYDWCSIAQTEEDFDQFWEPEISNSNSQLEYTGSVSPSRSRPVGFSPGWTLWWVVEHKVSENKQRLWRVQRKKQTQPVRIRIRKWDSRLPQIYWHWVFRSGLPSQILPQIKSYKNKGFYEKAENILKMKIFRITKIGAYPHEKHNTHKGVIRSRDLALATEEEISPALRKQGVTNIRRISIRKGGEKSKLTLTLWHSTNLIFLKMEDRLLWQIWMLPTIQNGSWFIIWTGTTEVVLYNLGMIFILIIFR